MAQSVIGALRVNLGLDSAKFEKGARRTESPLRRMKAQFTKLAAVGTAAFASLTAAAFKGAQEIDRSAKAARRLGASIGGFRALELAAGEAGVSLSGLANDVQNIDRELANLGVTGNADRALERLGLDATALEGVDADEKVARIADAIQRMGLTTGEATAVLRDLGIRNREMVLMMIQGGDAIRRARQDIEDYGLAISDVDAAEIEQANDRIARLGLVTQYVTQRIAQEVIPVFGRMAQAITDSLRPGGELRVMLDGLIDNLARISTYLATATAAFGARYVGAVIAARIATMTLSGALVALRGALIRTGIGALIVGAGELVYQFGRLSTAAGGVGQAVYLLGDLARNVFKGMVTSASAIAPALQGTWQSVRANFLEAVSDMLWEWRGFLQSITNSVTGLAGIEVFGKKPFAGLQTGLQEAANTAAKASNDLYASSLDAGSAAEAASEKARGIIAGAFDDAKESVAAIRRLLSETSDEMGDAATRSRDLADGLEEANDAAAGGAGGSGGGGGAGRTAREATEEISEMAQAAQSASDQIKNSMSSAFSGWVRSARNARDALGSVFDQISDMFLQSVGNTLFGGISQTIGGALAGGLGGAPQGMASGIAAAAQFGAGLLGGGSPAPAVAQRAAAARPMARQAPVFNIAVDGARGNAEIRQMVESGVSEGLKQYSRDAAPQVNAGIARDPRVRGG
ncbi:hypothetical protein [Palleronia sp. LCG004]|uniref:hypothetical protein n=1 Tax=Palleronia sp. LCG004 TaxID=3079304 RepID=UPI00294348D0|nr:hypothetical protein [Palleronia sp. LCG004]WOI54955.1 hypothetical protein RVY76_07710 [Palleronia sp. LCG004]